MFVHTMEKNPAGTNLVGEERLLHDQHKRIRDFVESPDGSLWAITDAYKGRLIRIFSDNY